MTRALVLFVTLTSFAAFAAEDLVGQVSAARAEVDELAAELEAERAAAREELSALARRKAELEGELDVARRTNTELSVSLAAREQARDAFATDAQAQHQALLGVAARLRRHVEGGLPFRVKERTGRVTQIEQALARGDDVDAAAGLDHLIEDELALSRSSEGTRHPVSVAGASALADVARIGLVLMFSKDRAGNAGVALRDGDGTFTWHPITDGKERAQIDTLIEALRRGAATGAFVVPFPAIEARL